MVSSPYLIKNSLEKNVAAFILTYKNNFGKIVLYNVGRNY